MAFPLALGLAGCYHRSDTYCALHPEDERCPGDDGGLRCTNNQTCEVTATPVCDVGSMTCVECLPNQADACSGTTPACGDDHECRGCVAHAECASSGVCLPDGSCADEGAVAYVDPGGTDNSNCTKATPCTKVDKALATTRPYLKLHGSIDEAVTVDGGRVVTMLGDPAAQLTRSSGTGAILTIRDDGTSVSIFDLTIRDAPNSPSGFGIVVPTASGSPSVALNRVLLTNNPAGGITSSGGTLKVTQSTISDNPGGGLSITTTQFDLTNNLIAGNGGPSTAFGGVLINQTSSGMRTFDFNTVTNNAAAAGSSTGVVCSLVTQAVTFSNNIIYENQTGGGRTQVGGNNCAWTYSDIGPDTVTGMGNMNLDPMFVNPADNNFHLQPGSPAKDAADPSATLATDIDEDARPVGSARDMGSDEITP
ncbi:MAG: choice-of-anchor Q domain-containing protein [Kofleriaceae bacterium]